MKSLRPPAMGLSVALLCLLLPQLATAQASWEEVPSMVERGEHAMVYDPSEQRLLVFGGRQANTSVGATIWAFAEGRWSPVGQVAAGMDRPRIVHDPIRDVFVAIASSGLAMEWDRNLWSSLPPVPFGSGKGRSPQLAYDLSRQTAVAVSVTVNPHRMEMWELGATGWIARWNSTSGPPWGNFRTMFDPLSGWMLHVVFDYATRTMQTWAFSGTAWHQITTPTAVTPLEWFELVRDPNTGQAMLFGGYESIAGMSLVTNQQWFFDGFDWQRQTNATAPAPRYFHAMAVDSSSGEVLVHGGQYFAATTGAEWHGDLWAWDSNNASWRLRAASPTIPSRYSGAMTFDRDRDRTIVFAWGSQFETMEFDGVDWTRTPAVGPHPMPPMTLGFDRAGGRVIAAANNGTWSYQGNGWTQLLGVRGSPPTRSLAGMVHDGQRLLLVGGQGSSGPLTDTWAWQSNRWVQLSPSGAQPATGQFAELPSGGALLASGNETWSWNGAAWQRAVAIPVLGRSDYAFGTDLSRGRVVLTGGFEHDLYGNQEQKFDAWEYDGAVWMRIQAAGAPPVVPNQFVTGPGGGLLFLNPTTPGKSVDRLYAWRSAWPAELVRAGDGCAGTAGVPRLWADTEQRPWIGDSFTVELTNAATPGSSWLALGFADDQWNGQPLPLELKDFAMPGCLLHLEPSHLLPMSASGATGSALWTGAVPVLPALVGTEFHLQCLTLDPGANAGGFVVSNRLRGLFGSR